MFLRPGDTKENLKWKRLELCVVGVAAISPYLFAVAGGKKLCEKYVEDHLIAGVVDSPYYSGHKVDLGDGQLRSFIEGLPLMSLVAGLFVLIRKAILLFDSSLPTSLAYYVIFGFGYVTYIHGAGVIFLIILILVNHILAVSMAGIKGFPLIVWIGNLSFLIVTDYYSGYQFAWISKNLQVLDDYHGIMKWNQVSNLFMLKIVSYMIDYHWKVIGKMVQTHEKHMVNCDECTERIVCLKYRMESHGSTFSLISFVAYCFYPPLYFAGPTLTYNGWISQVEKPQQTHSIKRLFVYFLRLCLVFVILMWFIHNLYFPSIANNMKNRYILDTFGPYELIVASFCILQWIWQKFTVIWRYFRLWALMDGVESPENMGRCMANNYGFEGFWRMWHRAFNLWLIRYLFIPLGGSKNKIFSIWVIFGFVAMWHDLSLNLLAWGWGMCIFIMPEVIVKSYINSSKMNNVRNTLWFSWVCAISGGCYTILMVIANLVGFSFGVSGMKLALAGLMNWEGVLLMVRVLAVTTCTVHFMFLYREEEARRGIKNKGY